MTASSQGLWFSFNLDTSGFQQGAKQAQTALDDIAKKTGVSTGQINAAMRTVPAQMTDVATQLAGGANPFLVLLQQGGQLRDSFGGLRPMFAGLASMITPATLAMGGLVGVVGAAVAGFVQGRSEAEQLQRSLALTGGAAGLTADQIDGLARSVSQSRQITIGASREIAAELVAGGKLSGDALASAANAAAALSKVSGQSGAEAAKVFDGITSGVAAWAAKANESYNFINARVYEHIRALEAQGKTQEAAKVAADALTEAMSGRQAPALSGMGKIWRDLANDAAKAWDAMKGIGKADTLDQQIAAVRQQIAQLQGESKRWTENGGGGLLGQFFGGRADKEIANLQATLTALENSKALAENVARTQAASDQANQQAIRDQSASHQAALANVEKGGAAVRLAQQKAALDLSQQLYDQAHQRGQISEREHAEALKAIDVARVDAQLANLNRMAQLERQRKPGTPDETLAQQAALKDIEAKRIELQGQRVRLLQKETQVKADDPSFDPLGDADRKITAAIDKVADSRLRAQEQANDRAVAATGKYVDDTRRAQAELIPDAEERARALLAIELDSQRQRLDLEGVDVEQRKAFEDAFATYAAARQAQLTEQLKPGWQRMVEGWGDTNRLMRETTDQTMQGLLSTAEDTWVKFVQTGKLSVRDLVNFMLAQFARLQFRNAVGQNADVASWLAKLFRSQGSGGGAAGGDASTSTAWTEYTYAPSAKGNAFDGAQRFAAGSAFVNSVVSSPTLFRFGLGGSRLGLMGEAGPEGILPLKRMGNGALGVQADGMGGGGGANVQVQVINNAPGAQATAEESTAPDGSRLIRVVVEQVQAAVAGDIARGGGPVSSALQRTYGLNRAAGAY